ncbi:hypothetical protein PUN28_007079 [Cardiocondyla obscurior]|uniref:Uncharacterized protein n=1 Tax=Cardiocondyla obscurior TaxID=286306 RepID=A0AAW2G2Y6_9HYME
MNLSFSTLIPCVLLVVLLSETTHAKPYDYLMRRQKRQSDQRLAEIETLLALQKLKGIIVPVGLGVVDPAKIGRKRRSVSHDNIRQLKHILLLIAQDAQDQYNQIGSSSWKEDPRDYQLI